MRRDLFGAASNTGVGSNPVRSTPHERGAWLARSGPDLEASGVEATTAAPYAAYGDADLLDAFASNEMLYSEFAARVRRRELGQKEDNDWEEHEGPDEEDRDPYD